MGKLERDFQSNLVKELKNEFAGSIILKMDSSHIQGIPDLLILHKDKWAALECKKNAKASARPNQKFYVEKMNDMSYASFIFPENREEVLDELRETFGD